MLELRNITKVYGKKGDSVVQALKGISLSFREHEFVSILGQSGCGKTTLLNIIGGLDRYTDGDLVINGISTRTYHDKDWDTYRNHSIGFVFQSYNLIPHQSILENVELTMTIGGVPKAERKRRAMDALVKVGLGAKLKKKPNQLSGGQMQRVSIARAIVSDPDIILADEPTGALDSETSKTIMDALKEISRTRLVIMVTHNPALAEEYSDRIISMLDGQVTSDTDPYDVAADLEAAAKKAEEDKRMVGDPLKYAEKRTPDVLDEAYKTLKSEATDEKPRDKITYKKRHSSMSFLTALRLSNKNLMSKFSRTFITSFAASIGVVGIAIILSINNGMSNYIEDTMIKSSFENSLTLSTTYTTLEDQYSDILDALSGKDKLTAYPNNTTGVMPYKEQPKALVHQQKFTDEFLAYLEKSCEDNVVDVKYTYNRDSLHILVNNGGKISTVGTGRWYEGLNNYEFLANKYTVLSIADGVKSAIPSEANEVALVVDKYNRLNINILKALGIPYKATNEEGTEFEEIKYEDLIGKEYRIVFNDGWYKQNNKGVFAVRSAADAYNDPNGITVKIISVIRQEKEVLATWLSNGLAYSPKLTKLMLERNHNSEVALAQLESTDVDVTSGKTFESQLKTGNTAVTPEAIKLQYEDKLKSLGYLKTPTTITIYPKDVEAREAIKNSIDQWNVWHSDEDDIYCADYTALLTSTLGEIVNIITYVLLAVSIIALIVSSIMIAIIIYASVIERTKEIGVLRSIGARKKDISRVFRAEAVIIGTIASVLAIAMALVINKVINVVVDVLYGIGTIATMTPMIGIAMVALSIVLLLAASIIPAFIAARKQPAVALRSE